MIAPEELVVDNFAGGGGATEGIEQALGRPADIAVNHCPQAIAMHAANHPDTRHFCESIYQVDPREACGGRRVGLAWFSPDCFPAGTMVLAREGYVPIEQIAIGDEVLTHGLRWKRVVSVMATMKPVVRIRGQGHPGILVSGEHPFLARHRQDVWNNPRRTYDRRLDSPEWLPAKELDRGWYWATPTKFPAAQPPPVPVYRGRKLVVSTELLWLAGRYVADGWTRLTTKRAELVITCGKHEVEELRAKLAAWPRKGRRATSGELAWHERETATAYQFTTAHRGLVEWLRQHFGHGAANKTIPGWALGMWPDQRGALLEGYRSGDGCLLEHGEVQCTTVSRALAFGVKSLATSCGFTVSLFYRANQPDVIEGRRVNVLPAYSVRWRRDLDDAHRQSFREEDLEWTAVRERTEDGTVAEVFNLSVEDDESYVVEGLVVHNCTHFSRAKGGTPRSKEIRGLAWVVVRWARAVRPRIILLENVEEFQTWGPLDDSGMPIKARAGETFREWLGTLSGLGYSIEFRSLVAADYGAPTTRRRLFMVARRDGAALWPGATHGEGTEQPWRTAAEVIDWSVPCRSIFGRKRPLAPATLRRIATGIKRYVLDASAPFVIPVTHPRDARVHGLDEPLRAITAAHRGEFALVNPFIAPVKTWGGGGNDPRSLDLPLRTITSSKRGEFAVVTPFVVNNLTNNVPRSVDEPLATLLTGNHKYLLAPTLIQTGYGERPGQAPRVPGLDRPIGTLVDGQKHGLVAAFLSKHFGGPNGKQTPGSSLHDPAGTLTTQDHHGLTAAWLMKYQGTSTGSELGEPAPTVTAGGGHLALVRAFLREHGASSSVELGGERYEIVDIGMRMLEPRELFRAQGFGDHYKIDVECHGKRLTKEWQIALVGNSVSPPVARELVLANTRRGVRRAA